MSITGIGTIGFGGVSAYDGFLMQSRTNLEKVIPDFENAIAAGANPNDVKDDIFRANKITEDDLTESDKNELVRRVDAIWEAYI